jgi:hypothetical protein
MKATTIGLLALGAFVLFNIANLGVAANVLQYYITSVDFTGLTTGNIGLVIQNPSNASILVNSMAGTITANGTTIGNISNFQGGVIIGANQQKTVNISVAISIIGLLGNLYVMLTQPSGANKINFVIAGNANINAGIEVPFNIQQTVIV